MSPTVLISLLIGGCVLLVAYIVKQLKMQPHAGVAPKIEHHEKRRERESAPKGKKKQRTRADKQVHPWLLTTLKGHTGAVLHCDYSSNGKYLATCGEEVPHPDPDTMSTTSSISSDSSNKENSDPSSIEASPRAKKGLSRRQRKNRRPHEDSSPDTTKRKPKKFTQLKQFTKMSDMSEERFADALYPHMLNYDQRYTLGYPVYDNPCSNLVTFLIHGGHFARKFDVNAREFIPGESSSSASSTADSEESSGSESGEDPTNNRGTERTCARCTAGFFVTSKEYLTQERCVYHWGKLRRGSLYACCNGRAGTPGCSTSRLHVWSGVTPGINGPFDDYVCTYPRRRVHVDPTRGNHRVYAVDCEMSYTVAGLELTKVTVVGMDGRVVYDTYVVPTNEVVDYNTRFSGITAKDLKGGQTKTLKEVQNDLRGFIKHDTVLVGHGLENDLRALKIVHKNVVDTASAFPHFHGLPYRRSLKSLMESVLNRNVQVGCHDSYEDACAAMELVLFKVRKEVCS